MKEFLKNYFFQIKALVIKDIRLKSRYKVKFLVTLIVPFTSFIVPFLIFRKIFEASDESFGIWTPQNYAVFILTGISIVVILGLLSSFGKDLRREKYWKTLHGLFMSPMSIYNLLFSKLLSELIFYAIPLALIFIICFIIMKASLITIFAVIAFYLMACLFIASIGLAMGSFRMSIEGDYSAVFISIKFFLIFSCYKYPKEVFPQFLNFFIVYNPFYYFFDLIRVILLLGFSDVIFNPNYTLHFVIVITFTILGAILSILLFNYVYKKYGIIGY